LASSTWRRRFGAGRPVVVADPGETSDDVVRDVIDVPGELPGPAVRSPDARNRVLQALACAPREPKAARFGGEDD
jgi:putative resolvase